MSSDAVPATILLIEDEPLIAGMYEDVLAKHPFSVVKAASKESAINQIQRHKPQLILLDLMIPLGSGEDLITYDHPVGFDILEWVRHHPEYAKTKVIVVTNLESDTHHKLADSLGVSGYVVKASLEPHDLITTVNAAMAS